MGIITEGLIGYWNAQKDCTPTLWKNIAPATVGTMDGVPTGGDLVVEGDGVVNIAPKYVTVTGVNLSSGQSTMEIWISPRRPEDTTKMTAIMFGTGFEMLAMVKQGTTFSALAAITRPVQYNGEILIEGKTQLVAVSSGGVVDVYMNGNKITTLSGVGNFVRTSYNLYIGASFLSGSAGQQFDGKIHLARMYNKALTPAQVMENYNASSDIGLTNPAPLVTITNITRTTVSKKLGVDKATVTFKFDKDVQKYEFRAGGMAAGQGVLLASGTSKSANELITTDLYYSDQLLEGLNKISIYGQDMAGNWTPYES
ncbi:hypothetical protein SHANETTE_219 [Bacillus phage Shanette]|uniref:LamG domain-containing protein n=1 Tax=Bacillus phage Shanette TaxID=1296656 RepID=S5M9A6_9CAUD|nr:hypothetical protein AVV46_gp078 [Bacillus phage Shanette]AGR47108.1 hypothetical protein SHANETTE_219 [Bacillus phage Shanette]